MVDELPELLDHLLGLLLVGLLDPAGLVEDVLLGEDRRPDPDGEGDGVGRAARTPCAPRPRRYSTISAKNVPSRSSVTTMRST